MLTNDVVSFEQLGPDEGSQSKVLCRINKKYQKLLTNTPSYLELCRSSLDAKIACCNKFMFKIYI